MARSGCNRAELKYTDSTEWHDLQSTILADCWSRIQHIMWNTIPAVITASTVFLITAR